MATTEYGPSSPERVARWVGQARRLPLPMGKRATHASLVKSARSGNRSARSGRTKRPEG